MKKIVAILLAAVMIFSVVGVCAEEYVTVTLNGKPIEFDVPAQIINDRTMVPMRKIFESLGAEVNWIEEQEGIVAAKGGRLIVLKIGSNIMLLADIEQNLNTRISLDVPPMLVNDRTLVPVRAVSEGLGVQVDWDEESQTVILTR